VAVHPGKYTVFNEDGTPFLWGKESVTASVTIFQRVSITIGDNMEPVLTKHLPDFIKTLTEFDAFTLMICRSALMLHTTALMVKLHKFQEAHAQIMDAKSVDFGAMLMGTLPVWRWIEKRQEYAQYQETCENLMRETMDKLQELAPEMLTQSFTIIFTEG
jgi:hypothetical protein